MRWEDPLKMKIFVMLTGNVLQVLTTDIPNWKMKDYLSFCQRLLNAGIISICQNGILKNS